MKTLPAFFIIVFLPTALAAQLTVQRGAIINLQTGSDMTLQGDLDSYEDISGNGAVNFKGSRMQFINMHGKNMFKLGIDNASNVQLGSPVEIKGLLQLANGHLQCGTNDMFLSENAVAEGGSTHSFIETNGTGKVIKRISQNLSAYHVPLGNVNGYTPLSLTSDGKYRSAIVKLSSRNAVSLHKPVIAENYIGNLWSVSRNGINGKLQVSGRYNEVNGDDQQLSGYYWDGKAWSSQDTKFDAAKRTISVIAAEGEGELYAFEAAEGNKWREGLKVFPNPVVSVATVVITSKEAIERTLQVVDAKGRIIQEKKIRLERGVNKITLNLNSLARGQYFIRLQSADNRLVVMFARG